MAKEIDEFLSLYKTYEGLLKARGTDYRSVEEELGSDRMRMMRQMRNYLSHSEDPGFITVSPVCLKALQQMVKEESLKGDVVKNHLIKPASGSVKEGTPLSTVVYKMVVLGVDSIPIYDGESKRLKGIVTLERSANILDRKGNMPLDESIYGVYGKAYHLVKPDDLAPERSDGWYYCCTKDGTPDSQYMGYLDI